MDGPVRTIREGVRRVRAPNPGAMTGTGTNTYLVGTSDLIAIDPGPDDAEHLDRILQEADGRIRYVLVTHRHRDHAPGARPLADAAGAPLLAMGFGDTLIPDSRLADGDVVSVPGFRLDVLATPGHASDHLGYLATEEATPGSGALCFSGDHVMGGSSVAVVPLDGSMSAYIRSLERLLALDPPIAAIAPGHGEVMEDAGRVLRTYLDHRLEREQMVLTALDDVPRAPADLVPVVYRGLAPRLHRAAAGTIWAHLRRLAELGTATSDDPDAPDGGWRRVSAATG